MKYILIFTLLGYDPQQVGPFDTLMGCERAAGQVATLGKVRTVCVSLTARPHTWNGKAIPK